MSSNHDIHSAMTAARNETRNNKKETNIVITQATEGPVQTGPSTYEYFPVENFDFHAHQSPFTNCDPFLHVEQRPSLICQSVPQTPPSYNQVVKAKSEPKPEEKVKKPRKKYTKRKDPKPKAEKVKYPLSTQKIKEHVERQIPSDLKCKLEEQRERNCKAAARCRQKKKQQIDDLMKILEKIYTTFHSK